MGEIKICANLHKVSNIKHVILGTIYVYKKNRNIIYSQQMQSKSWSSRVLARSSRQNMCAAVQLICSTVNVIIRETLLSMEIWQGGSGVRSYVRRASGAMQLRRPADRYFEMRCHISIDSNISGIRKIIVDEIFCTAAPTRPCQNTRGPRFWEHLLRTKNISILLIDIYGP